MSQPCARRNARSAIVDLEPGMRMRSASGNTSPGSTMTTETPGSARSGSRSSKFAIRGRCGTANLTSSPRRKPGSSDDREGAPPAMDSGFRRNDGRESESSAGNLPTASNHGTTPRRGHPVRSATNCAPSANSAASPRILLTTNPLIRWRSRGASTACVPTRLAITPPRSMSPTRTTGTFAASANPMLAMSPARRFTSAGLPAPSTSTRSMPSLTRAKLSSTRGISSAFQRPYSAARIVPARLPCTTTWAPVSVSGLSSTGFMWTDGGSLAARACSACARPISPPSAATAALFDIFCGLNGATLIPRRTKARQRPATSVDLPDVAAGSLDHQRDGQNSIPTCAFTPERNGCLITSISVTRSAASISSSAALRPVTIT